MPYSFTQIEKDKTNIIGLVFSFLIFFYFSTFWLVIALGRSFLYSPHGTFTFRGLGLGQSMLVFGMAAIVGYAHWSYTTSNLIFKILGVLKAEALNPKDTYHQRLKNIVEEVSVATGGRPMEAVVVPTMAMNAFAISDFSGRAVIGVTEGLLARLTRAQLEAVVGHEAAHIVTEDSLATTITSSLFELYNGILKGFELLCRGGSQGEGVGSVRFRGSARAAVFLLLIYILIVISKTLSQLARLFISRQREYRADAIAVRLTRDPLSLAEALYAIAYRWRGAGLPAQELKAIFTVNPAYSELDEQNGVLADMFSTHPPIENRIGILLDMAHTDAETLVKGVERQANRPRTAVPGADGTPKEWTVHKDGEWTGPFNLQQLSGMEWIKPDTWIQKAGEDKVKLVYEDPEVRRSLFQPGHKRDGGIYDCPRCRETLQPVIYEGVEVYKCGCCQGTLVGEKDIQRIIIREDIGYSERIRKIAEGIRKEETTFGVKVIKRDPKMMFTCPNCRHIKAKMLRMFYTEVYRIEIDRCFTCGMIWFDQDELEILQYMIEDAVEKI